MAKFNGVFKVFTTKKIPKGVLTKQRKDGSKYVEYVQRSGHTVKCELTKTGRMRVPSRFYHMMLDGKRVNLRVASQDAATRIALELLDDRDLARAGQPIKADQKKANLSLFGDPEKLIRHQKPLLDEAGIVVKTAKERNAEELQNAIKDSWLQKFEVNIRESADREQVERYIRDTIAGLRKDLINSGISTVAEFAAEEDDKRFSDYFLSLDKADRTKAEILTRMKRFERFLFDENLVTSRPISRIGKNATGRKLHSRRSLSFDEIERLIEVAKDHDAGGVDGPQRALIYRMAAFTGIRLGELAKLLVSDLRLDDHAVFLRPEVTKNSKKALIPLTAKLVQELSCHISGRADDSHLFDLLTKSGYVRKGEKMMQHDLKKAGFTYKTSDGFADFHALRTSFCNGLRLKGVHESNRKQIVRHASSATTQEHYDKITTEELRSDIQKLEEGGW